MKRIRISIGDIFEVKLKNNKKGYLQYIAKDKTQLNSSVIRVFKNKYSKNENPDIESILLSEVDFYVHIVTFSTAIDDGTWIKIGHSKNVGDLGSVWFRSPLGYDDGRGNWDPVSIPWSVWALNGDEIKFNKITDEQSVIFQYDAVTWPVRVTERMNTGKFPFKWRDYKENQDPSTRFYYTKDEKIPENK